MKNLILKHALKNAVMHHGKANVKAVMNKVIGEKPKVDKKKLGPEVKKIVSKVNKKSVAAQKKELLKMWPSALEKKPEKPKKLQALPGAVRGKVVLRFAPNPNGAMTLGAARGLILNWEYAQKYNGKFILRFDDSDPKTKPPLIKAYDWYLEDCKWLGIKPHKVLRMSDRVPIYYEYARKLIGKEGMYACTCPREQFQRLKAAGQECPCRALQKKETLRVFEEMLAGEYDDGEVVLRLKSGMRCKNPAVRDWVALRVIKKAHPCVGSKYVVWPTLDFASAIEDKMQGVTHIIRGKDLMHSTERQKFLYKYMKWKYPRTLYWGRVAIHEFGKLSTSTIRAGIEAGEFKGWSDPELPTIKALRKRGIKAGAVKEFWLSFGLSERDISASIKTLEAINRKLH
jgi:glutamyl-tRNA synthetase